MSDEWIRLMDRLLSGLAHDANGRAGAVRGLVALVEEGSAPELWLPLLQDEASRLERLGGALRAIAPDIGAEPIDVRNIVALAARALLELRVTLQPPEVAADTIVAVHVSRTAVVRAILIAVLSRVPEDTEVVVHCRLGRTGDRVALEMVAEPSVRRGVPAAAQALLETYDGRVEATGAGITLTLPALG